MCRCHRACGRQADGIHSEHEPSGEVLFLVLGVAVYLTVAVICVAAFLPPTLGVIVALGSVVLVAVAVATFFARFVGPSGH